MPTPARQPVRDPRAVVRWAVLRAEARMRALDLSNFVDLDELGDDEELDEESRALLQAMAEWQERDHDATRAQWDAAKHPRIPKGQPGGGRFRSLVDRALDALAAWEKAGGKGDPFKDFKREQLRQVALRRGIPLKRGEDRESIVQKLLADLAPPAKKVPAKKAPAKKAPAKKPAPKPGNRQDEVKAKIAQDRLEDLDYLDLRDLAREHGVEAVGRPKEDIISDVRREIAAGKVAAKAAKAVGKAKVPNANVPGRAGQFHRDVNGIEDLQRTVEGGKVVSENRLAGGVIGDTRIRTYADGTKLVWKKAKTKHENDAEQLAALTGRALGLNAPRIYRNEENAVNMEFAEGKVAYNAPVMSYQVDGVPQRIADTQDGRMMGLLDLLIDNSDRHNGNWLIRPDGRYVPIDHGYAFAGRPGRRLPDPRTAKRVRSGFAEHYYAPPGGRDLTWTHNDLTKGDVVEIRRRLEKLRPDFDHVGRADWHRFMMERLDEIGQNANGTRSRLLPALI